MVPFLVLTYFWLRGYKILPNKELHWGLWVGPASCSMGFMRSKSMEASAILSVPREKGSGDYSPNPQTLLEGMRLN